MSNITKNLNIYKDVTNLIGARSFGKEDLVVPYRQLIATVAGSPKIGGDLVARGFSSSSYIIVPKQTITNSFEMVVKFKTPVTKPSGIQAITGQITNNKTTPQLQYNSLYEGSIECIVTTSSSSAWYGSSVNFKASLNTWYWVKYVWNNGVAELLYSTNGIDYISAGTYTVPSIFWSQPMAIGNDQGAFFSGSIDLKETYIKVNGVEVWKGVKVLSQISRDDMQNYVLSGIEMQPVVGDSKAVIDFSNVKLPWKFEHSDKLLTSRFAIAPLGTTITQPKYVKDVNATIIGSPTVSEDFVASGFSISSYLQTTLPAFSSANNWEIKLKARTTNTTASQVIYHARGSDDAVGRFGIMVLFENSKFRLIMSSNNSSWDIAGDGDTYLANTDYYIKASFNGSKYELKYSTDDINYTTTISITSSKKVHSSLHHVNIGARPEQQASSLIGSIDLKDCYVKLDGVEVWKGTHWVATEEMETLQGCVRYYYGYKPNATTPPEDSTNTYNIYAVNGDEGVLLDSKWYYSGGLTTRPILGDGPIPAFENEWYLGEYRVETGEEGSPYSPDGGYFPGGGIVLS